MELKRLLFLANAKTNNRKNNKKSEGEISWKRVISEIEVAENTWSEWLAMGDWMVGPRTPDYM